MNVSIETNQLFLDYFIEGTLLHSVISLWVSVPLDTVSYSFVMQKCPPIVLKRGHCCIVSFCYAFRSAWTLSHGGTETDITPAIKSL